jgi:FixJ family two-component response regulator
VGDAVTVVVIEDDASLREATSCLLRSLGYRALTYCCAEEFLGSMDAHHPDCLISDIRMPGMDGFTLQATLNDKKYDVPLIFMTAFAERGSRERALAAGAHDFLMKPYREEDLLESIASAVSRRRR